MAGLGAALGCGGGRSSILPPDGPPFPPSVLTGSRAEIDGDLEVVAGELPRDMVGHALVVASLPYGDGTPLFTGDGMVYRMSFEGGRVRLRSRLLRTDCFLVDEAAGPDGSMAFRNTGFARMSPAFGARNFANTALVSINDGRLLATYDAGRPWEIDPVTLEVITPVGLQSSWKPFMPAITPGLGFFELAMATAHPAYDARTGTTFMVNYATPLDGLDVEPFVRVLWWDGASEPRSTRIVDEQGEPVVLEMSCHQMQVTDHFVILLDGAFQVEPEQMAGQDITRPQRSDSVLYFIERSALAAGGDTPAIRVTIPIESAHFLVDPRDDGRRVTLMLAHLNSADPSEWVRANDVVYATGEPVDPAHVGMMVGVADRGVMGRYVVDVDGRRVESERLLSDDDTWALALWARDERSERPGLGTAFWAGLGFDPALLTERIASAYADHPHRQVPLADLPGGPIAPRIVRLDQDAMRVDDAFEMPLGHLPMSPTFVPRAGGGTDEGYLVLFAVGPSDEVWIFDAGDIGGGPRCRLRHPQLDVPFTLHTLWLPELRSPQPGYRAERSADYGPRLDGIPSEARALARQVLGI